MISDACNSPTSPFGGKQGKMQLNLFMHEYQMRRREYEGGGQEREGEGENGWRNRAVRRGKRNKMVKGDEEYMQRGTGGQRHINTRSGQSVGHLSCLHPRILSVCLPAHPQNADKETFELSLRRTLQINKNMQQAWKEGRGNGAGWEYGVMPFKTSSIWSWRREEAWGNSCPLIPTPHPIHKFLLVHAPQASPLSKNSKPWAGKLLPTLNKTLPPHHPQGKGLKMILSCSSQQQPQGSIFNPKCTFREFCHLPWVIQVGSLGSDLGVDHSRHEHGTDWSSGMHPEHFQWFLSDF